MALKNMKDISDYSNRKNQQQLNTVSITITSSDCKTQKSSLLKPATWITSLEKLLKLRCIPITSTSASPGSHYYTD
jgi:hypothetical protein